MLNRTKKLPVTLGTIALATAALAGCSPAAESTQSTAAACEVAVDAMTTANENMNNFSSVGAITPEDADELKDLYETMKADIQAAGSEITNEEIADLFQPVSDAITSIADAGASTDFSDPAAMQDVAASMMEDMETLSASAQTLHETCSS